MPTRRSAGVGRGRGRHNYSPGMADEELDVTVVLPVYNEAGHVCSEIDRIRAALDASRSHLRDHRRRRRLDRRLGRGPRRGRGDPADPVRHQPGLGLGPQVRHPGGPGPRRRVDRRRHDLPQRPHPRAGQASSSRARPGRRRPHLRAGHRHGRSGCRPSGSIRRLAQYLVETADPRPQLGPAGLPHGRRPPVPPPAADRASRCVTTITMAFLANGYTVKYVRHRVLAAGRHARSSTGGATPSATLQVIRMMLSYNPLRVFLPGGDHPRPRSAA